MIQLRRQRVWFWLAAIAFVAAIALLLAPQVDSAHGGDWLAILPIYFAGIVSPLVSLVLVSRVCVEFVPDDPSLPSAFQRPPPFLLG
jgi:hypothetical protein